MAAREPLTPTQQRWAEGALGLVRRLARRLSRRLPGGTDDLVSVGQEALVEAARTFDPTRDVPFEGFAYVRVYGEMRDHCTREHAARTRARVAFAIGAEELNEVEDTDEPDPLNDTVEQARERARDKARDFATAAAVSFLLNSSPVDPERELMDARERSDASRVLREALAKLPPDEAALAHDYYERGLTLASIATARGLTERTLQRHHHRLLMLLRDALASQKGAGTISKTE